MSLTLLIGGARSGKTSLAVDLGTAHDERGGDVVYLATAPEVDDDMAERIARHRRERPTGWTTIEEATELAEAIEQAPPAMVIVDCLTLWTSNLLWHGADDEAIDAATRHAVRAATKRTEPVVAITNEVGLGIVPDNALARRYRDVHGRVNQVWAAAAHDVLLLVAGRAVRLDDPRHLLDGSN